MFASLKLNALLSGFIMTGCVCSPEFAASVVAGAVGTAVAALIVFGLHGGPGHPVQVVLRKGREMIRL